MAFPTKEARMAWYHANREQEIARAVARKAVYAAENMKLVDELRSAPCLDCGVSYPPYVMDFDHVRGTKLGNVTTMARNPVSKAKLLEEIAKCEVVCSNCHRQRTHERRQ